MRVGAAPEARPLLQPRADPPGHVGLLDPVPHDGLGAHELSPTLDGRGAADLVELFGSRAAFTEATR